MITALAFVPPDDVAMQFEALSEEFEILCPKLQHILDWLEMYYIGMLRREGVRRLPMFSTPTWNLYSRVLAERMVNDWSVRPKYSPEIAYDNTNIAAYLFIQNKLLIIT